jgi:DnaB-like helicase C terminal domain
MTQLIQSTDAFIQSLICHRSKTISIFADNDSDRLTSLGCSIAFKAISCQSAPVLYFNLSHHHVHHRIILAKYLDLDTTGTRSMGSFTFQSIKARSPVFIFDDNSASTEDIVGFISLYHRDWNRLGAIIIDCLQLITDEKLWHFSIDYCLGEMVNTFHELAKKFDVPIFILADLNNWDRTSSDPVDIYDIADSDSIEQVADLIVLLEPDRTMRRRGQLLVPAKIVKDRDGPRRTIDFNYNIGQNQFV